MLPASEMERIGLLSESPSQWTYPEIRTKLLKKVLSWRNWKTLAET